MKSSSVLLLGLVLSVCACASTSTQQGGGSLGSVESQNQDDSSVRDRDVLKPAVDSLGKIMLYLTASGKDIAKPSDEIRMDSNRMMQFTTRRKAKPLGDWETVSGLALLDPEDYATLDSIFRLAELFTIDQSDISATCSNAELVTLVMGSTERSRDHTISFNDCAADYNLLLGQQRVAFGLLWQWFERVRVKYRPVDPDKLR